MEKFYYYTEWLQYLCDHFLAPWGYVLNGEVTWEGEDHSDVGLLKVVDNKVTRHKGFNGIAVHAMKAENRDAAKGVQVTVTVPRQLLERYEEDEDEDEARQIAQIVLAAARAQ
jgi:hypothetical protein